MSPGLEHMGGFEQQGFVPEPAPSENFDFQEVETIYENTLRLAEAMDVEVSMTDMVFAMQEVFENFDSNVDEFEARLNEAMLELVRGEVMAEVSRLTVTTDNWEEKLTRLRELRNYVDSDQVDVLAISFCERVLGDYCERLNSMSPEQAFVAIQDLIHDQSTGMFGRLTGTLQEFGDSGVTEERMFLLLRTTVRNLLAKNLDYTFESREDYLNHIENMPVDMEARVRMAVEEVTQIEQVGNMDVLGEPVDWYMQEVARASVVFEFAMERFSSEQLDAANNFYEYSILPILETGIRQGEVTERIQIVRTVLNMAETERQRFIEQTPSGQLTRIGLGAYQRLGDIALVQALEEIPDFMLQAQSDQVDELLRGRPMVQMYLAQQQMSSFLESGQLFTYDMRDGFLPTEEFAKLPIGEQQGIVGMLQEVQFRADIESLVTAFDLPDGIGNVYQAQLAFMEGNTADATRLVEEALDGGNLQRDLSTIDFELSYAIEQQFGFSLEGLGERAVELRKQCYLVEINELDGLIEDAGRRFRAGILTNMRGLDNEYNGHEIVRQMLTSIRSGVEANMSWEDAYERAVSRLDYFNTRGFENAQSDEGYQPFDLIADYTEIFRESDPELRKQKVLDLSRRAMDTHGVFGMGYFGLAEGLIESEFSDEFGVVSQVQELQNLRNEMLTQLQEEMADSVNADIAAGLERAYGEEWSRLSPAQRNVLISERAEMVYNNVADEVMLGETLRYVANNPERFYQLGDLVEVADLYNTAAVRYNRILVFEEMVEPLLVAAIETAIAIPLGLGVGRALTASATIARVARMGRLGRVGAATAVRLAQGVTIQTARGLTRGTLTNDWSEMSAGNWAAGTLVEASTMGLLGYTSRFDLTNGLTLLNVLKTGAAYAGETTALTLIDRAGDRIAGRESDTFAQDFIENGLFVFMARSIRGSVTLGSRAQISNNSRFAELYRGMRSTYIEAGFNAVNVDQGII